MSKIVLRGFGLPPNGLATAEWEPALRELRLSVFPMTPADVVEYVRLIDQREIDYLYGYPSAIELMCRHMSALGIRPKRQLKAILPISEPVYTHQRGLFADVLGPVPVQGFYGLSEKAAFAIERLREPDIYDFHPLYGAAELVDWDGAPITEIGKQGRIVATGFLSTGMPFIRYDTEDLAELVETPTPENGYRLAVRNIVPRRKPNFLVAADGNRVVTIDFTPDNPRYFEGLEEYQFHQVEPGKVTIRYIPTTDGTLEQAQRVADGLTRRTHGRIVFTLQKVEQLAGGRAGKRAFIDQRLDLSRY
jgi:phenylacetate-CoA ligase